MQALPKKDAGKMDKHVFRVYDTNGDGFIDFVEFMVSRDEKLIFAVTSRSLALFRAYKEDLLVEGRVHFPKQTPSPPPKLNPPPQTFH